VDWRSHRLRQSSLTRTSRSIRISLTQHTHKMATESSRKESLPARCRSDSLAATGGDRQTTKRRQKERQRRRERYG